MDLEQVSTQFTPRWHAVRAIGMFHVYLMRLATRVETRRGTIRAVLVKVPRLVERALAS